MAITVEKKFRLDARVDDVWRFMADPAEVAVCLPGVELTEIIDEVTYAGNVRVKVGPMTVAYAGEAKLTERDDARRTFTMVGKGKEKGGAGSAKLELTAKIAEVDGGVEVNVSSSIDLTGKVVRFGRGMMQAVSDQLFEEFVANLKGKLEIAHANAAPSPSVEHGASAPEVQSAPVPAVEPPSAQTEPPSSARVVSKPPSSLGRPSAPVAALPLFFRVLQTFFRRVFGRMFGRQRNPKA